MAIAPTTKESNSAFFLQLPPYYPQQVQGGYTNELKTTLPTQELDPQGLPSNVPGAKLDKGKVDVLRGAIQYFPKALMAVAHVSELGARKYSWKGWETVPDGVRRYGAALLRHLMHDDPYSTDSGVGGLGDDVLHASQVAWNALARLELILKEQENAKASST